MNIGKEEKIEFINAAAATLAWIDFSREKTTENSDNRYDKYIKDLAITRGTTKEDFNRSYRDILIELKENFVDGRCRAIVFIEPLKFNAVASSELIKLIQNILVNDKAAEKIVLNVFAEIKNLFGTQNRFDKQSVQ